MQSCVSVRRKDYMERIMSKQVVWNHNVEGDAVEGTVDCASRDEVVQTLNEMKIGKALDLQMYHWS